ncbi:MAG: aromatic aminobenezylarsenical efflux permease ArsG family transporter [Alistipes sp.]
MEYLQTLLDGSTVPVVTAFLLGLLTAISPCPLATNITAIGYISRQITSRNRIFREGLLYAAGRIAAYTALGAVLITILRQGASMFALQKAIATYGEMLLAPALIVIGLFMLFGDRLHLSKFGFSGSGEQVTRRGGWGALLLGALFALAFCPTSGVFYFGILIPMSAAETGGYLLPAVFALATALPVVIVAWILAYSAAELGRFYHQMQRLQRILSRVVALLFIAVGIYYGITYYL